jgi:hypothetical protein
VSLPVLPEFRLLPNHGITKTIADLQSVQNRFGLDFTFSLNAGRTAVMIVSAGETFSNLAYGTASKYNVPLAQNTNWKLYLQSYWGSGVTFQNVTLQNCNENHQK